MPASATDLDARPAGYRPWLHWLAIVVVAATFLLVAIGGNVTSLEAGLAVPDWPTTFGYNMFLAPLHVWWEQSDRFWEHFHRLMGSFVGVLTIALAIGLGWTQRRSRPWLAGTGLGLLALVCIQGVMGGLRVEQISIGWAIIHGITGQLILATTVLVATATSWMWLAANTRETVTSKKASLVDPEQIRGSLPGLRYLSLALVGVLIVQLVLGAWVRHTGATLAIPDFPTTYGHWLPPMSQAALDEASQSAFGYTPYITLGAVWVHYAHRIGAAVVLVAAFSLVTWLNVRAPGQRPTKWPARWLMGLLGMQIALGAAIIWGADRHPLIATAHQAMGAALLAVATWLAIRVHLLDYTAARQPEDTAPQAERSGVRTSPGVGG